MALMDVIVSFGISSYWNFTTCHNDFLGRV